MEKELLEVRELNTSFKTDRGYLKAVDGVSFSINEGEILGVVGESGCGKSVTMQSIMRLYDEKKKQTLYEGEIFLLDKDLLKVPAQEMQQIRGRDISMIFQDALSSLDPVFTVGQQINESLKLHTQLNEADRNAKIIELLKLVGINSPEKRKNQYPHEFSGGMRQRIMIAIALSCHPKLLLADEPTTALDVTIQAQIMDLLKELNKKLGMSIILITHDMSVIAQTCQTVIVMYLGQVVEKANVFDLFDMPTHPYTQGLIKAIPSMEGNRPEELFVIKGTVPLLSQIPQGCRFAPRCQYAKEVCYQQMPAMQTIAATHSARCWKSMTEGPYYDK